ncbi:PH domain-containing protein [Streptomyces sp. YIM S03343]
MESHAELSLRWQGKSVRWWIAGVALFAVAAGVAARRGVPDAQDWGIFSGLAGVAVVSTALGMFRRRVEAGPDGLRFRTVLRWRRLRWDEIVCLEDLRVAGAEQGPQLRVAARLLDGSMVPLPVPWVGVDDATDFERQLSQLRALHHRYGRSSRGL